jgi:hypothetical protein
MGLNALRFKNLILGHLALKPGVFVAGPLIGRETICRVFSGFWREMSEWKGLTSAIWLLNSHRGTEDFLSEEAEPALSKSSV